MRRQNLVHDKQSKTGIVLHLPTVHPVLLQTVQIIRRPGCANNFSFSSCSMTLTFVLEP